MGSNPGYFLKSFLLYHISEGLFLIYLHAPWTGVDIIDSVHMYMFLEGMDLLERFAAYWTIIGKHLCCMDLQMTGQGRIT